MPLSTAADYIGGKVLDVKFSPNYADDAEVLALTTSATEATLENVIVEKTVDSMNWNESYKPVTFYIDSTQIAAEAGFLAFGDNYDANGGKVFIALSSTDNNEVYRVPMSTASGTTSKKATQMKANDDGDVDVIYSLSYNSGKLAFGTDKDIKVNTKADSSTTASDWTSAADETQGRVPSGINMLVAFNADASALYAATSNVTDVNTSVDDTFGSVFASSSNYTSFDGSFSYQR